MSLLWTGSEKLLIPRKTVRLEIFDLKSLSDSLWVHHGTSSNGPPIAQSLKLPQLWVVLAFATEFRCFWISCLSTSHEHSFQKSTRSAKPTQNNMLTISFNARTDKQCEICSAFDHHATTSQFGRQAPFADLRRMSMTVVYVNNERYYKNLPTTSTDCAIMTITTTSFIKRATVEWAGWYWCCVAFVTAFPGNVPGGWRGLSCQFIQ